mgnify:CR=1 FL=1
MTLLDAILLGTLQGLTEFLPISSSGHLVLGQMIIGVKLPGNQFEVVAHLGTLLSVFFIYWKEILLLISGLESIEKRKYLYYLILGTLPAGIFGFFGRSFIIEFFDSIQIVSFGLIFTGLILFISKRLSMKSHPMNFKKAFLIGLSQAIAIIPGISRSGMTICMGISLGMSGKAAAKFSFLLAIPAIAGAGLLTILDFQPETILIPSYTLFASFFSSFIVGYGCLKWLLGLLESGKFYFFGYYCIFIGVIMISII